MDEEGTCARNICECDRRLAESLLANKDTYNQQYHTLTNDGAWSYNNQCRRRNTNQKYGKATECCGESFPDMIPKQEVLTFQQLNRFSGQKKLFLQIACERRQK